MKTLNQEMILFIKHMDSFTIAFKKNEKVDLFLEYTSSLEVINQKRVIWIDHFNKITTNDIKENKLFTLLFTKTDKVYLRLFGNIKQFDDKWREDSKYFSESGKRLPIIFFDIVKVEFIKN